MAKAKRLICVNVPVTACNLKCHYCYITLLKQWDEKSPLFRYSAEYIGKSFSQERLGGPCIINLTGAGETLIAKEMPEIIKALLQQGHYLEIVTNGTLTKRFEEIASFPEEMLKRIEFKFSFHYLELKRLKMLDVFSNNVNLMKNAGCSFTVECMPNDDLIPHIDELKVFCMEHFGALCQLTVGRDDTKKNKKILTAHEYKDYVKIWSTFRSTMFQFKLNIFYKKRKEFCYAGAWSLYVDLITGDAKACYGQPVNQNIFEDLSKPIRFIPVGHYCRQPHCYNGHAFLTLGVIPGLKTPSYAAIRNRVCADGSSWLKNDLKEMFETKLCDTNSQFNFAKRLGHTVMMPLYYGSLLHKNMKAIKKKLKTKWTIN